MPDGPGSALPPRTKAGLDTTADASALTRGVIRPAQEFIHAEGASGRLLILAALAALVVANSPLGSEYQALWATELGIEAGPWSISHSLLEWVNSGLMAIFFFLVTLEVKEEVVHGSLSSPDRAILPIVAAIGGLLVPAAMYVAVNAIGSGDPRGWGVPIATDIAFAVAIAALLRGRVPPAMLAFLLAFAIVDDIAAILVIAVFYTQSISLEPLAIAGVLLVAIVALRRVGLTSTTAYLAVGVLVWLAISQSGIHATIAGVLLALLVPTQPALGERVDENLREAIETYERAREEDDEDAARWALGRLETTTQLSESPLDRSVRLVHPWSGFVVLPIFAFANAGIALSVESVRDALVSPIAIGILVALVIGKPLGVFMAVRLTVATRRARLPEGAGWRHILGIGMLAGIGFTVSIFIARLAFSDDGVDLARLAILAASVIAALGGWLLLRASAGHEEDAGADDA